MTTTSEHGWEIPDVGGDNNDWGNILNAFFDDELDREVSLKDTFANRPAAGSSAPLLFLATDRDIVYYNDGSSWTAIYGKGTTSDPFPNILNLGGGINVHGGTIDLDSGSGVDFRDSTDGVILSVNEDNTIEIPNGGTPASTGALRFGNQSFITSRNSGDTADVNVIGVDDTDDIRIGDSAEAVSIDLLSNGDSLTVSGDKIIGIGTGTSAGSGDIRIANSGSLKWRNSGDTSDVVFAFDSNDKFLFNDGSVNLAEFHTGGSVSVPNGNLTVSAGGPNATGELSFANTRIYEDANGEIVVEDSAGNTTTIS